MTDHLLERFLTAADRDPDRIALSQPDKGVTYAQLARMVGSVGTGLAEAAAHGGRVAILSENSAEYVAALYGTWAAGMAAVGLNPMLRAQELGQLARHARVTLMLLDERHPEATAVAEHVRGFCEVVPLRAVTAGTPHALPAGASASDSDALATIIYTSGTTGHPKGVMLSHRNLAANTMAIQATLPIRPDDRALCVLPFQYSYGASVLHTHLTLGATILLERSLMYLHTVVSRLESERATSFAGVPSTFYLLMDRLDLTTYDLTSLRYVTQAGGRMDPRRIETFHAAVPGSQFIVMYGQTEASARLTCLPAEDLTNRSGSVGRAIPGVQLEVRGEDGQPVGPGEQGEVWVKGDNVMQGYWADPAETADVLVDGWLRTRDLGRLDRDGYLFLDGRSGEFIKSGAYRIAPSEVEDVIRSCDGVVDVAVVGRDDPVLGEAIHAHVVSSRPGPDLERAIRRVCADRLARYKLPKMIHFRDALPRTASGKVRKHLL